MFAMIYMVYMLLYVSGVCIIFPHFPSVQLNISPFEIDSLIIFTSDKDDKGTAMLDLAFGFIEFTVTLDEPPAKSFGNKRRKQESLLMPFQSEIKSCVQSSLWKKSYRKTQLINLSLN